MQLNVLTAVPEALLQCQPQDVHGVLGGPSLFFLEGHRSPPLFVTILQHGNEPTGFDAVQHLLRKYGPGTLPRPMWLFIANTEAAAQGVRFLAGQQDYNRCWPGSELASCREVSLMHSVVDTISQRPLFASVDLHNNTGQNPHYGCVNSLDHRSLQLARLFSRTVVYFTQPPGVQSMAMSKFTPSVTLECGKPGEEAALDHAVSFLDACLHWHHIPDQHVHPQDIHLLQTKATVRVRPDVSFGFGYSGADLSFAPNLDHYNFGIIPAGSELARLKAGSRMPVLATNNEGGDVTSTLFVIDGEFLIACRDLIPSMATTDVDVVRQDCLFYVMEELSLPP